jgi:hypothetical protein
MKTMTNGKEIVRVSDAKALKLEEEGWAFCSKERWKKEVRDRK